MRFPQVAKGIYQIPEFSEGVWPPLPSWKEGGTGWTVRHIHTTHVGFSARLEVMDDAQMQELMEPISQLGEAMAMLEVDDATAEAALAEVLSGVSATSVDDTEQERTLSASQIRSSGRPGGESAGKKRGGALRGSFSASSLLSGSESSSLRERPLSERERTRTRLTERTSRRNPTLPFFFLSFSRHLRSARRARGAVGGAQRPMAVAIHVCRFFRLEFPASDLDDRCVCVWKSHETARIRSKLSREIVLRPTPV